MGFDGVRWFLTSCFYMLQKIKILPKKCQLLGGPWGLPFYSHQKLPSIRGSNSIGACFPTRSYKAKACKGTVEPASAASATWAAETAVPNFIVGICDDMTWNDMKWYGMVCGDLMGFEGVRWLLTSCFYMLQERNTKQCQTNVRFWVDLEGCHFIVPKNCLRSGAPILWGRAHQKGSHKAKARKGTVEAAPPASATWAAETAVPNFIVGICDDMTWNDMKWLVMICGDLMGFERIWWLLTSCFSKCHACHADSRGVPAPHLKPSAPPGPARCHTCHACRLPR